MPPGTSPFPITGFNTEKRLRALELALKDHIENPVSHTPEESDTLPLYDATGKVTKKIETFYKASRAWRVLNTVYSYAVTAMGDLVNREQRKRA